MSLEDDNESDTTPKMNKIRQTNKRGIYNERYKYSDLMSVSTRPWSGILVECQLLNKFFFNEIMGIWLNSGDYCMGLGITNNTINKYLFELINIFWYIIWFYRANNRKDI